MCYGIGNSSAHLWPQGAIDLHASTPRSAQHDDACDDDVDDCGSDCCVVDGGDGGYDAPARDVADRIHRRPLRHTQHFDDDDADDDDVFARSPRSRSRYSPDCCQLWVNSMWLIRY